MVHLLHLGMSVEEFYDLLRVLHMALDPQRQGLEAL
jgi:hypothetical protein